MNHLQLEKDIQHLEHVMARFSLADRIPWSCLSYWRNRVASVSGALIVPSQAHRVRRLNEALRALEARENDMRDTQAYPQG